MSILILGTTEADIIEIKKVFSGHQVNLLCTTSIPYTLAMLSKVDKIILINMLQPIEIMQKIHIQFPEIPIIVVTTMIDVSGFAEVMTKYWNTNGATAAFCIFENDFTPLVNYLFPK
jgi:hypothetical protein